MAERRPHPLLCALPTTTSVKEAELYQEIRSRHCAAGRDGHHCLGRISIDRAGITLSCPRCGDARSLYTQAGTHDG